MADALSLTLRVSEYFERPILLTLTAASQT